MTRSYKRFQGHAYSCLDLLIASFSGRWSAGRSAQVTYRYRRTQQEGTNNHPLLKSPATKTTPHSEKIK